MGKEKRCLGCLALDILSFAYLPLPLVIKQADDNLEMLSFVEEDTSGYR